MASGMTWDNFLKYAKEIVHICNKFDESWVMLGNENEEGSAYLVRKSDIVVKRKNVCCTTELDPNHLILDEFNTDEDVEQLEDCLLKFEHHIMYSMSYGVPILAFNAWKTNGTLVSLEEAWKILDPMYEQKNMYSALTQMDHVVLQKPILTLHPCTTSEFIAQFIEVSKNPLITWLSSVGPAVHLKLPIEVLDYMIK